MHVRTLPRPLSTHCGRLQNGWFQQVKRLCVSCPQGRRPLVIIVRQIQQYIARIRRYGSVRQVPTLACIEMQ
jgi:hypothetical protein